MLSPSSVSNIPPGSQTICCSVSDCAFIHVGFAVLVGQRGSVRQNGTTCQAQGQWAPKSQSQKADG